MKRFLTGLLAALLAVSLTACGKAGISGAASMRVEVEVYKGPIGKSREIQIGELSALLADAVRSLRDWQEQAEQVYADVSCGVGQGNPALTVVKDCTVLKAARMASEDVIRSVCRIGAYRLPSAQIADVGRTEPIVPDACREVNATALTSSAPLPTTDLKNDKDPCHSILPDMEDGFAILADTRICAKPTADQIKALYPEYTRRVGIVTSQMQLVARRLADSQVGYVPQQKVVRHSIASLTFLLGELSNSIAARNAILQKLFERCLASENSDGGSCDDGSSKLPTSDYLRDVEPTQFMEAFDWFNADLDATGTGAILRRNRTRAIKALSEDYYWEKVNEVYASGQGDVSMAFIKDELGNWNLKSYTNDPSALLAAYRGAANAALASAVQLARASAGDPTAISRSNKALDLVERLTTGKPSTGTGIGGMQIDELRSRTDARLKSAQAALATREDELLGSVKADGTGERSGGLVAKLEGEVNAAATAVAGAQNALAKAEAERSLKQAALADCPAGTDCVAELATAIEAVTEARSKQASALADQRKSQDALAVARAEADKLGEKAAEVVDSILMDYQHDLAVLQQTVMAQSNLPQESGSKGPVK